MSDCHKFLTYPLTGLNFVNVIPHATTDEVQIDIRATRIYLKPNPVQMGYILAMHLIA
jgi:hypothetical protein